MNTPSSQTPGFLMTQGGYYGTLAATRCLGRLGIKVYLADQNARTVTGASHYVHEFFPAPPLDPHSEFVDFLIEIGKKRPGLVLYPTSDEMAWIVATYQDRLRLWFKLYQPPQNTIYQLLNKKHLNTHARALGIEGPRCFYPSHLDEVLDLEKTLRYPVIIKPKTQIGLFINVKGFICHHRTELLNNIVKCLERFPYKPSMLDFDPDLRWPMIQEFHPEASRQTYSLSGFALAHRPGLVLRGAVKVLQQPLQIGVGLAFKSSPIIRELEEKIQNLIFHCGYYGAFEAEFICLNHPDRYLLIDFNPRFYGQMGFDIKRGLPIPLLTYWAACDHKDNMDKEIVKAKIWDHEATYKFCFGWMLRVLLNTQFIGGKVSYDFRKKWLQWATKDQVFDATFDVEDPKPHKAYIRSVFKKILRHPRSSFSYYFR